MDNHTATQHEFVRKCLRYMGDEADLDEREQLEVDLPEFAATIIEAGGYNLDQQLTQLRAETADLSNERDILRAKVLWLENSIDVFIVANRELTFAFNLAEETCRKLEAERNGLRAVCELAFDYVSAEYNDGTPGDPRPRRGEYEELDKLSSQLAEVLK